MPGLLAISQKVAASGRIIPHPPQIRAMPKLTREWGAMGLDARVDVEPWQHFILRVDPYNPEVLARRDLRRLASEIWDHPNLEDCVPLLVKHCASISKRSLDRRLARAYWNRFKIDVPMFAHLAGYCASRQKQLGSPWGEIANEIPLWDCDLGPAAFGRKLLHAEERDTFLQKVSLRSQDLQGGFVEAAFRALLLSLAGKSRGQNSIAIEQDEGDAVLSLGKLLGEGTVKANADLLAYVLLKPWTAIDPDDAYRDRVMAILLEKVGDPRTSQNNWDTLADTLARVHGLNDAPKVLGLLHQWITEKTVRLFFDLIARTTDRPDQWRERRAFWEAYLDNKFVERAWFALGQEARGLAQVAKTSQGLRFGRVGGSGAASGQSVLLMKIGDMVIAEWSDNGRARFWMAESPRAPKFNQNYYEGQTLRSMSGGPGFEALAHQGKWYRKFADHIAYKTGIPYKGPRTVSLWGW